MLTFNNFEKTKRENFNFVRLLSFFFIRHNWKTILCMRVLNVLNDRSGDEVYSDLLLASGELRLASYGHETVSRNASCAR